METETIEQIVEAKAALKALCDQLIIRGVEYINAEYSDDPYECQKIDAIELLPFDGRPEIELDEYQEGELIDLLEPFVPDRGDIAGGSGWMQCDLVRREIYINDTAYVISDEETTETF